MYGIERVEQVVGETFEGVPLTGGTERAQPAQRSRPVGISVLAVLNVIGAVVVGVAALAVGSEVGDPAAAGAAGAVLGLAAVLSLVVAVGLWKLRNWARITALVLYSLSVVSGLASLILGDPSGVFQMLVAGGIVTYLCRARVREAFCRTDI